MSDHEHNRGGLIQRLLTALAKAIGFVICEPQLRLGRRQHDGDCDRCDETIDRYAAEKLDFPLDDLGPDASSSREKLRAMWNAEYVRYCLECAAELEDDQEETADS